ncbi:MAG: type II toxin-antitoxin system prevent-host-death family antitoxin [Anaerolineae bacterium]
MERILSVSETRGRLTGLVQQVAERGGEIIITTRDEPMAVLMSYRVYRRWRERQRRQAQAQFAELLSSARELIETTLEGGREAGDSDLYLFWNNFKPLAEELWQAGLEISEGHALITSTLLDVTLMVLDGDAPLQPEHLSVLKHIATDFLPRPELAADDAAQAHHLLIEGGLRTVFPVEGELASLYEESL